MEKMASYGMQYLTTFVFIVGLGALIAGLVGAKVNRKKNQTRRQVVEKYFAIILPVFIVIGAVFVGLMYRADKIPRKP